MYAMVATGLALMFGVVRLINFAHGSVYMVGGFIGIVGLLTVIVIGLTVENVIFRTVETRTVRRWGMQS